MSYCPKCGNKVEETMVFCPHCGAPLKEAAPSSAACAQPDQVRGEKTEKREKNEKTEKGEVQEKSDYSFVGYLVSGLILITVGIFASLQLTLALKNSSQALAAMLLIIGAIIIVAAVYVATRARKKVSKHSVNQPA